ncbi:MAG: hypothetical protein INH37_13635 [Myxococcaceae bacterium]|nr:hypothetical protein [Myxococcaceae bacterium]
MPNVYPNHRFASRVYGDAFAHTGERDLSAISAEPMTLPEWREVMREATPNGYNAFDAPAVALMLAPWGTRCQFFAAREGSVAVYVTGDEVALDNLVISMTREQRKGSAFAPDEVGYAILGHRNAAPAVRLWWD